MTELGPPWSEIAPSIKARIAAGRQKQLAHRLGLTESGLSNYLSGKRRPPLPVIAGMADFFGVGVDTLLGRETGSPQPVASPRSSLRSCPRTEPHLTRTWSEVLFTAKTPQ